MSSTSELSEATIQRWQRLFRLSSDEAAERIKSHRSNVSRTQVPDEHWELVRHGKEAAGYDREAYQYEIEVQRQLKSSGLTGISMTGASSGNTFLLKLDGPLNNPTKVQEAAGLLTTPAITRGADADDGTREASFCYIDNAAKQAVMDWLWKENITGFYPTIIPVSRAYKDLSSISAHPTLGEDSTMPQHRATDPNTVFRPMQDEYPVWYFFYGSLADAGFLLQRLAHFSWPLHRPASIIGGVIKSWAGKYPALVDGPETARIDGWAFHVVSREYEDALRLHYTEAYEIVRCSITVEDRSDLVVKGLVFRFAGQNQALS
jgi:Gamma-glutamyl cyclotransferase, AIG2-like